MASPARSRATGSPWARAGWLEMRGYAGASRHAADGTVDGEAGRARILVGVDGRLEALIVMGDRLRPGADTLSRRSTRPASRTSLSSAGTGGRSRRRWRGRPASKRVYSEQTPEGKLEVVRAARRPAEPAKRRHGRRRHQRCAGTRARGRRHCDGRQGSDDLLGDGRRRHHRRRREPDRAVGADRPPLAPHRTRRASSSASACPPRRWAWRPSATCLPSGARSSRR